VKVSTVGKTLADFPELVEQIDEDTHSDLDVQTITAGTNKKLKWVCDKGPDHKWEAAVWSRTGRGSGCPFCSGRALSITNCLETRYPEVAKQWHPTRNEDKTPKDFTYSSNKKVWWLCPDCGDDWKAQITNRTLGNSKRCRDCGHKISAEKRSIPETGNSLLEMCPQVSKEWHPTKNGDLEPSMVFPRSSKLAWWVCGDCKHEWNSVIAQRTEFYLKASLDSPKRGRGCDAGPFQYSPRRDSARLQSVCGEVHSSPKCV
jgi:predicted RNA-binding Zn-ribbon protein involved in translation (DUF1610 family)